MFPLIRALYPFPLDRRMQLMETFVIVFFSSGHIQRLIFRKNAFSLSIDVNKFSYLPCILELKVGI